MFIIEYITVLETLSEALILRKRKVKQTQIKGKRPG